MAELEEKLKSLLDSPESMSKIMQAAQSLMGEAPPSEDASSQSQKEVLPAVEEEPQDLLEKLDPHVVTTAMQIMNEYRKTDDRRIQLLQAMRSYFRNEDQLHISKAIQIVKLSKVAKQAFKSFREEDSFV